MPKALLIPLFSGRKYKLWLGDCLEAMNRLPSDSVDLVFADPPFNIGHQYDVYSDSLDEDEYLAWSLQWLRACCRLMAPTASLYVAIGARYQAEVKRLCHGAGLHWRNTIVWHYTFGPNQRSNWVPSWVAIHYFTKHPKVWTWNQEEIKVPSARQLKYNDRRASPNGKTPDNVWVLLPDEYRKSQVEEQPTNGSQPCSPTPCIFPSESNCWLESRICGTFKERTGHPCQMPLPILERIVRASSSPGDLVLDPFLGSGTTGAAALKLGRRFWGIELSREYLILAAERMFRTHSV